MLGRSRLSTALLCLAATFSAGAGALNAQSVTILQNDPARSHAGLTTQITGLRITGPPRNPIFRVFDMDGQVTRIVRSPITGWEFGALAKPLPLGGLIALMRETGTSRHIMAEIDRRDNVTWLFDPQPFGLSLHHDFQRLPNGNVLMLASASRSAPWIKPGSINDDVIFEVDRTGSVVWAWSTVDHIDDLPITEPERAYIRSLEVATVFHTNSIQALPPNRLEAEDRRFRRGNILASQRDTNIVFLLDRQSGDVVWSYKDAIGQHHARMIPHHLPGAGNILIYDNGGRAGLPPKTRSYSRVIELDPITKRIVWSYECSTMTEASCSAQSANSKFYAAFMGSSQRLPNGNTLISELPTGRVFEVTPQRQLVWEYQITAGLQIYRAYRFEYEWMDGDMPPFVW